MNRIGIAAVALAIAVSAASPAAAGQYPQDHNGWSIGFGGGGASAGVTADNGASSDREGSAMGNFRLGYPLNDMVSLAYEGNAWTKSQDGVTLTFAANTFGVAVYPSEGLVLRGGLGFGSTTLSAKYNNVTTTSTESGFGLHAAMGYDFRLARTFAIGPQVDYGYTSFSGGHADWYGAGVNFNWYFVKAN